MNKLIQDVLIENKTEQGAAGGGVDGRKWASLSSNPLENLHL